MLILFQVHVVVVLDRCHGKGPHVVTGCGQRFQLALFDGAEQLFAREILALEGGVVMLVQLFPHGVVELLQREKGDVAQRCEKARIGRSYEVFGQ